MFIYAHDMDTIAPEVIDLQSRIWSNRLRVAQVIRKAEVAPSTWTRWVNGSQPNLRTLRRVSLAVEVLSGLITQEQFHSALVANK